VVDLSDIAGSSAFVSMLRERVIEPIRNHSEGASTRIIIYGPPGTGKTFVAKAVAGEIGLGFKRLTPYDDAKELKSAAAYASRQTLVYFDELEWVNYRPVYMDALMMMPKDVLVVGATNHPWRVQYLTDQGFGCLVFQPEPDAQARAAIFNHAIGIAASKMDLRDLVELTKGYSASDIHHLCEWVSLGGHVDEGALETARGKYKTTQMDEWVAEAKANAEGLDKEAFRPLLEWLAQR